MRALLAALLVLPALAGCLQPAADVEQAGTTALPDASLGAPEVDAAAVLAELQAFVDAFPLRRGDNAYHNGARDHLAASYDAWGYEVLRDEYRAPVRVTSTPTNALGSDRLVNVVGVKWGIERPDEWVVVGAHYDVTDGAVHGAYDDGSGTLIVLKLAEAFASRETSRTLLFVNFDGEEQGRTGSIHMMERLIEGTWLLDNGTVVAMLDFDMAGITYPASPPLVADAASPEMRDIILREADRIGFPRDMLEFRPIVGGSSDNGAFKAAEVPSVLFISDFDDVRVEGHKVPGNYPWWHKLDTYESMVRMAGGEENLRAGFQNVVDMGAALLWEAAMGAPFTFEATG